MSKSSQSKNSSQILPELSDPTRNALSKTWDMLELLLRPLGPGFELLLILLIGTLLLLILLLIGTLVLVTLKFGTFT